MRLLFSGLLMICAFVCTCQDKINLTVFSEGYTIPVDVIFDEGDQMYVVQKFGTIIRTDNNGENKTTFLDIGDRVNAAANERGLLGLALHPDFSNNGYFYVNYTTSVGTQISRFGIGLNGLGDPDSEDKLLFVDQPYNNHNAGALHFGPDGYLYIGMGDGGKSGDPENRSQNPMELLGKMLRIDVDGDLPYEIPFDNPYANDDFTKDEIWAFGLRNPWKFSFDQANGDMYIADVGQNKWEEIDFQKASSNGGENYGWRCYEGFEAFKPEGCGQESEYVMPVFTYFNDEDIEGCSVTGGYVYRNDDNPYLYGRYIYGDFCSGKIWALNQMECGNWTNEELLQIDPQELSTFGQDKSGSVYVAKLGAGKIYKIEKQCDFAIDITTTNSTCGQSNGTIIVDAPADATVFISAPEPLNVSPGTYDIQVVLDNTGCEVKECVTLLDSVDFDFPMISGPEEVTVCEGLGLTAAFFEDLGTLFPELTINLYEDSMLIQEDWDGILLIEEEALYQVEFVHSSGCSSALMDFLKVILAEIPDITIIQEGDDLVATPGFVAYNWFEDLQAQPDVLGNVFMNFKPNVDYRVIGFTLDGCKSISDNLNVVSTADVTWIESLKIAPNPVKDQLTVELILQQSDPIDIKLMNAVGQILDQGSFSHTKAINKSFPMDQYPAGNYFIVLKTAAGNYTQKIIKSE